MVGAQNDCGPDNVMTEVLEACDYRKQLPPSWTIISLWWIHNAREKGDGALYSFHCGGEYRAHRDIRRIGDQNKSLVWLGVSLKLEVFW